MDVLFEHGMPYFDFAPFDTLLGGDSKAPNFMGAIIFWTYILAALYFTYDILRTILALRKVSLIVGYDYNTIAVAFFSLCAFVSFSVLSYNMLNVLFLSYSQWSQSQSLSLPRRFIGESGLLGADRVDIYPWTWSISSSLFRDFAEAITSNAARWAWSQAELGCTVVTAFWMGIEGRRGKPMPNLWTFFLLLEILPTSITQALFMLALLFTPRSKQKEVVLEQPTLWLGSGLIYFFLLVEATQPERRQNLMLIVLFARLLLLAPLRLPLKLVNAGDPQLEQASTLQLMDLPLACAALTVWTVLHQSYWAVDEFGIDSTLQAIDSHPAVRALGFDAVICLVIFASWSLFGQSCRPRLPTTEKKDI